MFKRFFLALAVTAGLLSPSYGAGTIPFSLSQQFDQFGKPLAGCQFYTIQAGTTSTPQNVFQDSALTLALPNPQTCDASGRLPQFFAADGSIKIRLTDKNGVNVLTADNVQVIGNSSGGGGGSPVDPTTVLQTGWMQPIYGTGVVSGFVRLNGRTIGSSSSGATERANADTQALFQYLWGADPNLTVSTGRGVSANADWVANKQLTLPDWSGRALGGLDDMGAGPRGVLTSTYFGTDPTVLGAPGGSQNQLIAQSNFPHVQFSVTATGGASTPIFNLNNISGSSDVTHLSAGNNANTSAGTFNNSPVAVTGTADSGGVSAPLGTVSPLKLATIYIKL